MRTTITLDPEVEGLVRAAMRDRGLTFKQAVNEGLRAGLRPPAAQVPYRLEPSAMGDPAVPITKALELAADLEDAELVRRLETGR